MKNNMFVINKEGKLISSLSSLDKLNDPEFSRFVQIEAGAKKSQSKNQKPEYLLYAKKFGFDWEPNADMGFMRFDYKADLILRLVKEYARQVVKKIGLPIYEVSGSNMFDLSHPVVDAYAALYGDRLFRFKSGKKDVVMSYDCSYPQFNLAGEYHLHQKDLPFAHFSINDCYRHEQSGECMLLFRQRRFFMPDLHPYFKNVKEAFAWFPKIEEQILNVAVDINRKFCISIEVSSEKYWQQYKREICEIAKQGNQNILVQINQEKKDFYWIINADYKIIDALDQSREIACIQIDVGNAQRLGIKYSDKSGNDKYPVIIHSAPSGGVERYLYMLFDNFKKSFPMWLYPVQLRLIPVSEKFNSYCEKLLEQYPDIRIDIDDRSESVGKRIKAAHEELIPQLIVIGEKEVNGGMNVFDDCIKKIRNGALGKPFLSIGWPRKVSQQIK